MFSLFSWLRNRVRDSILAGVNDALTELQEPVPTSTRRRPSSGNDSTPCRLPGQTALTSTRTWSRQPMVKTSSTRAGGAAVARTARAADLCSISDTVYT